MNQDVDDEILEEVVDVFLRKYIESPHRPGLETRLQDQLETYATQAAFLPKYWSIAALLIITVSAFFIGNVYFSHGNKRILTEQSTIRASSPAKKLPQTSDRPTFAHVTHFSKSVPLMEVSHEAFIARPENLAISPLAQRTIDISQINSGLLERHNSTPLQEPSLPEELNKRQLQGPLLHIQPL